MQSTSQPKQKKHCHKHLIWKILAVLLILAILAIALMSYFKGNVIPIVMNLSEATVRTMGVNAINTATNQVLQQQLDYNEFVTIDKDKEGNIQAVQANTVAINKLGRQLANVSQAEIEKIKLTTIQLPLGAFTGSIVLSDYGPNIDIPLLPIGNVYSDFTSIFEEVGINQTRHCIYINLNTVISLVLPISSVPISITTSILVCENIIIGKVPDVYFDGNAGGSGLDLVPNK